MTTTERNPSDVNHAQWSETARGPNGRGLCRICLVEVPAGRRTFCGKACVERHWIGVGAYRAPVWKRDQGLCALCGLDTDKLDGVLSAFRRLSGDYSQPSQLPALDVAGLEYHGNANRHSVVLLEALGWHRLPDTSKSLWEADHIRPLAEGGRNEIANLRTLCVPCHKTETRALARRIGQRRRFLARLDQMAKARP